MIKICPAILTHSLKEFLRETEKYSSIFPQIDIDINIKNDSFDGVETLPIEEILEMIKDKPNKFGLHLMVEEPMKMLSKIYPVLKFNTVVYVHDEASRVESVLFDKYKSLVAGIVLQENTSAKDIVFLRKFSEVQLMTVKMGEQGGKFNEEVLQKAIKLKEMGYNGIISVDGGVNLETAEIIKKYPIDRVSVGSFFSKSMDIKGDYEKLNLALNH